MNQTQPLLRATPELPEELGSLEQLAKGLGFVTQLEHGSLVAHGDSRAAARLFRPRLKPTSHSCSWMC